MFLATPDIVSLDEPVRNGQTGESAEESNVMEMYRALTKVERNQAAEWMFVNGSTMRGQTGSGSHQQGRKCQLGITSLP